MGSFLVVLAQPQGEREAKALFHDGLGASWRLGFPGASETLETPEAFAAVFPRSNGSHSSIAQDAQSGSWLLSCGSWFHRDGYSSGAEARLLARYLEAGGRLLGRELEGFFILAIGDKRRSETLVITDLIGSCHGFLRSLPPGLAISNSSLLLAALSEPRVDPIGVQEFLATGVIYEDRTIYREVRKLGPARVYAFQKGGLECEERYWQVSELTPESLRGEAAVDALWQSLKRAAKAVARAHPRIVCDFTGGHDSRVLVGAFLGAGADFATTVGGPQASDDVRISRGLASLLGLQHIHFEPRAPASLPELQKAIPLTDGEYDLAEYWPVQQIHHTLSEHFDISVNGSFGEVGRGYWWELLIPWTGARRKLDARRVAARRYAVDAIDSTLFAPELRLRLVDHLAGVLERTNAGLFERPNTFQMDSAYLGMRMQRWQGRIASSTNRLWPCISPFMFRTVLEIMLQTETRLRRRGLLVRKMLARFQPRLSAYPLDAGYPAAPLTWRNWRQFYPALAPLPRKAMERCFRRLGSSSGNGHSTQRGLRLSLWKAEGIWDPIDPRTMLAGDWLDAQNLAGFLQASRQANFPYDKQWTRLLSLELALRERNRASQAETHGPPALGEDFHPGLKRSRHRRYIRTDQRWAARS